jgi:putative ABC transport system permease protein
VEEISYNIFEELSMNTSIYIISLLDLLWVMIPVAVVIVIYMRWTQDRTTLFYALFRMLVQLILIGYVLTYIFSSDSSYLVILILSIMLVAASVIALRPIGKKNKNLYLYSFISIFIGSIFTLLLVVLGVLNLNPWYEPLPWGWSHCLG